MNPTDVHDRGAPPVAGDAWSLPSHAVLARTLLGIGGYGSLGTLTGSGHPYGSLVAYAVDDGGSPLLCLSEMAEHTRNAHADPRAGLLVTAPEPGTGGDRLDEPRLSLVGELRPSEPSDGERQRYLDAHPTAAGYIEFADFGWWRLAVASARFVGGFGAMSWVSGEELAAATPDPVIPGAGPAVEHMNDDHREASLDMARHLAGLGDATGARVASIDSLGVTLQVTTDAGPRVARVAYLEGPVADFVTMRDAVVALAVHARERAGSR
jgi:putative heme iron utilization protein